MQTLASHIVRAEGLPAVAAAGWIIRLARTLEPVHALGVAHGVLTGWAILADGPAPGTRGQILAPRLLLEQAAFHSPERAAGEGPSPEDDTWAAAVLLYFGLTNALPFPGADDREVRKRILVSRPAPLATHHAGDDKLQEIVERALARRAHDRITSLSALREALEAWHPHPAARELPPLEHEGSLLLSLCPAPTGATPAPAPVSSGKKGPTLSKQAPAVEPQQVLSRDVMRALPQSGRPVAARKAPPVPVIHEDLIEDEDAPTRVRDVPQLLAQLAVLQSPEPPEKAGAPAEEPELSWRTPAPPGMNPEDVATVPSTPSPLVPLDRDTVPGNVAVSTQEADNHGRIELDRASAPVLPLVRDSAPGEVAVSSSAEPAHGRIELDRPSAPVLPFERESAPPVVPAGPSPVTPAADNASVRPAAPSVAEPPAALAGAPEALAPAPKAKSQSWTTLAIGIAAAAVLGGVAYFALRPGDEPGKDPGRAVPSGAATTAASPAITAAATPEKSASAPAASATETAAATSSATETAPATSSATASASATATLAPAASPSAAAAAQEGVAACMASLFPTGTFATPPAAFDKACQITDPREGARLMKLQVTIAGENKRLTDGMKEWAIIGWFGMPAFELLRTTCCASPPEIRVPFKDPLCDLEGSIKRIAKAATSKTGDDAELAEGIKAYSKAVICTANSGASGVFGQKGGIVEGELVTFQKTLARVQSAVKSR